MSYFPLPISYRPQILIFSSLKVEFALKLGYPEDLTKKALTKVGMSACQVCFLRSPGCKVIQTVLLG